jgi:ADP-ribosylation factor GTPase-activating protein 1
MAALAKGWSLFAGAVSGASKAINESVIQPSVERVQDPTFQANMRGYVSSAGKQISQAGSSANEWGKGQFGVDIGGKIGSVVGTGRERAGYGSVPQGAGGYEETSALYHDEEDEDDMGRFHDAPSQQPAKTSTSKKDGWDDNWDEF